MTQIPAVTIRELAKSLREIAEYARKVRPENLEKAEAMLAVIQMNAEGALEKAGLLEDGQ